MSEPPDPGDLIWISAEDYVFSDGAILFRIVRVGEQFIERGNTQWVALQGNEIGDGLVGPLKTIVARMSRIGKVTD